MLIVDIHLKGGLVIVVGVGNEGLRKIESLLTQNCKILVIGNETNSKITKYIKEKKIQFVKKHLKDAKFLTKYKPVMVMATTDDRKINRMIVNVAREIPGCMVYASDDPDSSDFSHPSVINIKDTVQVAVSTDGKSPAMAKKIRLSIEKPLKEFVTDEDVLQIELQHQIREKAKNAILNQTKRKRYLYAVMHDDKVADLIKQGKAKLARNRAMDMMEEFV